MKFLSESFAERASEEALWLDSGAKVVTVGEQVSTLWHQILEIEPLKQGRESSAFGPSKAVFRSLCRQIG